MAEPGVAEVPIRSYRDLRVWQRAMDLADATYRTTERFPADERYGLVTQMRRAAVSVASNIAEGHARSRKEYLRYLLVSNGSLREIETQLILSKRLGFLGPEQAESLLQACDQIGRMLGALRNSLRSPQARTPTPDPGPPNPA